MLRGGPFTLALVLALASPAATDDSAWSWSGCQAEKHGLDDEGPGDGFSQKRFHSLLGSTSVSFIQTDSLRLLKPTGQAVEQHEKQALPVDATVEAESSYPTILVEVLKLPERVYAIAKDVTYNNLFEEVITFPERRPRIFNVLLATTKTWLADLVVQLAERRKMERTGGEWHFDSQRSASFAFFGFLYVGIIQWIFYISIFSIVCPSAIRFANEPWAAKVYDHQGRVDLVKQVCYDNFILETLIYFPIFYIVKESMRVGTTDMLKTVRAGLDKYRGNFKEDNIACWLIWIPADFAIFAAPMWMRMPLDHMVSFGWTMLLSHLRGGDKSLK